MDSYGFIDSIQVEKANALARYRRFHLISKIFRAIEVFIAVALISWSSTRLPTVFKLSGEYLYACSSYVLNQHMVFLVGNLIVVLCYALSGHGHGHGHTGVVNEFEGPVISEDIRFRSSMNHNKLDDAGSNFEPSPPPVEVIPVTLNLETNPIEKVEDVVESMVKTESETAIKQAVKQIERFNRTQSAKLSREISTKPRRDLRRSVTERRRNVTGDGDLKASTVENLSNEEFRLAVEAFITKRKSLLNLKQQSM